VLTVFADAPVRVKRGGPLHGFSHTDSGVISEIRSKIRS
jgi:hypothetical protein